VVLFTAAGLVILGRLVLDGEVEVLLMASGMLVVALLCIAAAVEQMRGRVSPAFPGRDMQLLSPIAIIFWFAGFALGSVLLLLDLWLSTGEYSPWLRPGIIGVGVVMAAGVFVQIGSLSDQWPDKWRPPYARHPEDPPAAEPEWSEPSDSDERP
jgi:hypothetical protein